jgi:sortase (surface protein transpeptidase)
MAETVIYYHLYNKKSGTVVLSPLASTLESESLPVEPDLLQIDPAPAVTLSQSPALKANNVSRTFLNLSKFLALVGIVLIVVFYAPNVLAWGQNAINGIEANFSLNTTEVQTLKATANVARPTYQPPFDPLLSRVNNLIIPSIGVDGSINEATLDNFESALKKGVWRVSDFGAPNANSMPIILAAHRFGYLAWTDIFRRQNSFYNLPKVKVGDVIEINWQQRHYVYEVYSEAQGTAITDYSADLILYTCESLTGDQRFFVYAKLIKI